MEEKLDSDTEPSCSDGGAQDAGGDAKQPSADPAELNSISTPSAQGSSTSESKTSEPPTPISAQPPSPLVSTMEQAISTGDPAEVSALLKSMDEPSAVIRQLTGCYGGRRRRAQTNQLKDWEHDSDENGLFRMTVPLLHAAYTGNSSMFSTVYLAMRDNLRPQQVKRTVASTDLRSYSVLSMAVASQSKAMVETVLAALEDLLTGDEVKNMLRTGDILHLAAASGSKDVFDDTLVVLESRLTHEEVQRSMKVISQGPKRESIMMSAAGSGDKETWNAVLAQLERSMSKTEVKKIMMGETEMYTYRIHDGTIFHPAIRSGSIAVFEAVLAGVNQHLTPDERDLVMLLANRKNPSILHVAAEGGDKGMFEAVCAALKDGPGSEELEKLVGSSLSFGRNILHFAASSGSKEMFEAVLAIVKEHQVKPMMVPLVDSEEEHDAPDGRLGDVASVLHVAASSGSKAAFEAVLVALQQYLTPDEVRATIKSRPHRPEKGLGSHDKVQDCNILHSAALCGDEEVVEAALAAFSPDEVETMIQSTRRGDQTALRSAVMSGNKHVFEAILGVSVGRMPPLEVKNMLIPEAKRSRGLLGYAAVQSGSIELVQAVFLEVGKELLLDMKEVHGVISAAATLGSVHMWEASTQAVTNLCGDLLPKTDPSVVLGAIGSKDPTIVRAVYSFVRKLLPAETDSEGFGKFIAAGFSQWTDFVREEQEHSPDVGTGGLGWAIEVFSCFLEYPAVLDPKDVVNLSRHASEGWMRTCFLDTVASVENPSGMTLSVALAEAAVVAPRGERRKLLSVQIKLDICCWKS